MATQELFSMLRDAAGPLWAQAQDHPFVHALGEGTLPRDKFIHYLKQDYAYLTGYSRAIALASAKAPDLPRMTELAGLLHETLHHEMRHHRDYCSQFDIAPEQLAQTEAAPSCRAYLDFGIATAATGDMLDLLAALIPCGVGYAEIGARLRAHASYGPAHPYRQWIDTYASEEYQQHAQWMIEALNELGANLPAARLRQLTELFRLGCRYEWLFWEMAWREESWPL